MDKAVILFDATIPPIVFAADKLGDAIEKSGMVVDKEPMSSLNQVTERFCIVLTTIQSDEVSQAIAQFKFEPFPALAAQGYAIRNESSHGQTVCWVIGADASGAMYGALDIVDAINTGARIEHLPNKSKTPFTANRGIKFNIPLDARTPSYSMMAMQLNRILPKCGAWISGKSFSMIWPFIDITRYPCGIYTHSHRWSMFQNIPILHWRMFRELHHE